MGFGVILRAVEVASPYDTAIGIYVILSGGHGDPPLQVRRWVTLILRAIRDLPLQYLNMQKPSAFWRTVNFLGTAVFCY